MGHFGFLASGATMIVSCPGCGQSISNKQSRCPHCGLDLAGSGAGRRLRQAARRRRRQLKYRLEMLGFAAMLLTVAGAVWMYFASDGFERPPGFWPVACLVAGALWYVAVRVYSIFAKLRREP